MATAPDSYPKVGDTFYAELEFIGDDGQPVDLAEAGITPRSSLLSPDNDRRVELEVDLFDQTEDRGRYSVRCETADFVPGNWTWDIRYSDAQGDFSSSTPTVRIFFAAPVTL
jgi:hypothetical protein